MAHFYLLKALSASIEMEVFVHRKALFLNIVGEITRMAKVMKEISSDLLHNEHLPGGRPLQRGGAGETLGRK